MTLGEKIKTIRKRKNFTLKYISEATNLSIGFLSNIERNVNSPSISNLQQICQVLNINLMEILDSNSDYSPITKKEEREEIFSNSESHVKVESLFNGKSHFNGIAITIENGNTFSKMSWGHSYDEIGVVIEGELEIEINKEIYSLKEGDSIVIKNGTPHKYKNPTEKPSIVYWFSSKKEQ